MDVYAAAGSRLDAASDRNLTKMVSTTGSFYQHAYGGPTSTSIAPFFTASTVFGTTVS